MTIRVLLVEDNPVNSELVGALLEAEGHHVDTAPSAAALRKFLGGENVPDLLLMDILLPDANGVDLLQQMRTEGHWPDVPVIAVTAQALAGDAERFRKAGFDGVIAKPINTRTFVSTLLGLVAAWRMR